ncbi:hypothetical protein [Ktedonobacter racemifer]|uniref:ABC-2 type transporter n=1 Tax=Ktedonobacter racemifer DSM 44963 TaxID=485913 RepID=D6U6C4_KTERA|nr:hypothetical protein [Ktedonobacter racemifer]EFH80535.1 conserved hypothetical protein [Ktedonobacter racemifer DSM 44963]
MVSNVASFVGIMRYEFRMQIRRIAVWIVPVLLIAFQFSLSRMWLPNSLDTSWYKSFFRHGEFERMLLYSSALLAGNANLFLPLGVGILMADRWVRTRSALVEELVQAFPVSIGARILGTYLGNVAATLVPVLLCYGVGVAYVFWIARDIHAVLYGILCFAVIMLPGMLFVSAFSLAGPVFFGTPFYRFLFICYWFWGNLLRPGYGVPTISRTILTPVGIYMANGFFGVDIIAGSGLMVVSPLQGLESLLALVGTALAALGILWGFACWRQRRC